MTKPVFIPAAGVLIGLKECADIRLQLTRTLDAALRSGERVSPDTIESVRMLDTVGAAWANRPKSGLSSALSSVDPSSFVRVEWESMTTKTAAGELGISPQRVGQLIKGETLHGEKSGRTWRVCAESVRAHKEGSKCPH